MEAATKIALRNSPAVEKLGTELTEHDAKLTITATNVDLGLIELETLVTELVGSVEEAYWDLWRAHRVAELWNAELERQLGGFGQAHGNELAAREQTFAVRGRYEAAEKQLKASEQAFRQLIGLAENDGRRGRALHLLRAKI